MIKKLITGLSLLYCLCVTSQAAVVRLAWDACCNTNIVQYNVYFTTNTLSVPMTNICPAYVDDCGVSRATITNVYRGSYASTNFVSAVGFTNNTVVITNLTKGVTYYFYVTCKSLNEESDRSTEFPYKVPLYSTNSIPSKPTGVRVLLD